MARSVSKSTRFNVFKRDSFTCQYCGRNPPAVVLEVDHVHPVSKGGTDEFENLLTACFDCNRGKAAGTLGELPASTAANLADRVERAEQMAEYNAYLLQQREQENQMIEQLGFAWFNRYKDEQDGWTFADARAQSIRTFARRLPVAHILEAMDIAFAKYPVYRNEHPNLWKYFCGVCWQKIKQDDRGGRFTEVGQ